MSGIIETPDRWIALWFNHPDGEPHVRLLSGWWGGYLGGDRWKLSSGCVTWEDHGEWWSSQQHSGTVYKLHKETQGFTGMTTNVFNSLDPNGYFQQIEPHLIPHYLL